MLVYALKAAVALKDRFFASARILQKPQTQVQIGELVSKKQQKTNEQNTQHFQSEMFFFLLILVSFLQFLPPYLEFGGHFC